MNIINKTQLLRYAHECRAAMRDTLPHQHSVYINDDTTGLDCYVSLAGDTRIVTFRGSEFMADMFADWRTNFKVDMINMPERPSLVRVHKGYSDAYFRVKPQIEFELSKIGGDNARTIFCGHSAGGAYAQIAFLSHQFCQKNPDSICVSYASPRVFDRASLLPSHHILNKMVRVTAKMDPVPGVPIALSGYKHIGTHIYLTPSKILINPSWFQKISFDKFKIPLFRNHSIDNYINLIARQL